MKLRPSLAILALASGTAACTIIPPPSAPPLTQAPPPPAAVASPEPWPASPASPALPPPTHAASDFCGAQSLGQWINALPTSDVRNAIASRVGERVIRTYTAGDPLTMDFSAVRLNVELGSDGRIKRFWCG